MNNNLPEVIDLFSGCGGLALGFQKAGFQITHGIEIMPEACETVSYNLDWRFGKESNHICGDITQLEPTIFQGSIGPSGCIVIGGPPCQAYSIVGRSKLRSLGNERINTNDRRGYLFQDFLRFALSLEARAIVMENVPEATNFGGRNIPQEVSEILEANGYYAHWTILTSSDFGVPQIRERVFLIAIKKSENRIIEMPNPSHYNADRKPTQGKMRAKTFAKECGNFVEAKSNECGLFPWVTVGEAISDLPELFANEHSRYFLRPINESLPYKTDPSNAFQLKMRTWFERELSMCTGHCFRKTPRDFPIFARMKQGDDYLAASRIADKLFRGACHSNGITEEENPIEFSSLKKKIVPPYDRDNFTSKWQKLCLDKPSHTLVAHLSVDTYSHIHPVEPRGISVREAARLQSFPDGFLFQCSMGDAYKQIGNAVPPLMAEAVALEIKKTFEV